MAAPDPPRLTVHRHDAGTSVLVTLVGEIDLDTVPMLREALESRLHDGVRTVDVCLAAVSFCDVSGVTALVAASQHTLAAGVSLLLHEPGRALVRLLDLTGTGFLLSGLQAEVLLPHFVPDLATGPAAQAPCPWCGAADGSVPPVPLALGCAS
jgi:anti-sigma B factor antagonist